MIVVGLVPLERTNVMDYKQKWEWMKEWLEQAIEEGQDRGYDKNPCSSEGGMFYAYNRMLDEMKIKDGEK